MSSQTPPDSTIILGGGLMGLSTAYYLSLHRPDLAQDNKIHILDSAPSLHLAASCFAGGFLAKDWFAPATASLGALSFRLHKELADAHEGHRKWGYSDSTAYSLSVDEVGVGGKKTGKKTKGKDWLLEGTSRAEAADPGTDDVNGHDVTKNGEDADKHELLNVDGSPRWMTKQAGGTLEVISSEKGAAQVEPRELCEFLVEEIEARGVKIHVSHKVTGKSQGNDGNINGVKVLTPNGEIIMKCKDIVISAGAWSTRLFKTLFPTSKDVPQIKGFAGYSITVRSPRLSKPIIDPSLHTKNGDTGICHSVFCGPTPNWKYAPEAVSRVPKSGKPEIYVGGVNENDCVVPEDVTGVKAMFDPEKAKELKRSTILLTGLSREGDDLVEDDLEVVREALCIRPVAPGAKPIVTRFNEKQLGVGVGMTQDGGVFMAAGHGPWGISMSLGTGLVMSEMILGKKTSADITQLGSR